MKPKALIVASVASMIEQFNIPNIKLLLKKGYEVHVACNFKDGGPISAEKVLTFQEKLKKRNVIYHQIDFDRNAFNLIKNYKAYRQLKKVFQNNFYLVHSHTPIGGVIARLCAMKYRKEGLITIYTAHGFHFFKGAPLKNWFLFYPVEKYLSRFTDKLLTINAEDYTISKNKFHANEVVYIPGVGIDLDKFKSVNEETKLELRKKMEFKKDDFILIQVGELNANKNQKLLIEAVDLLKEDIPKLKVLLVGTGPLRAEYEVLVENKNLEEVVYLLGYRTDINDLMALSDIAISVSKREGLPVNVMEAMAIGLPLVVTDSRGNRDLVKDQHNGYVVSIDNIKNLSNKIKEIYFRKEKTTKFSENNLKDIKVYSVENILTKMEQVYE